MATARRGPALLRLVERHAAASLTDRQLLERFAAGHDEAAFAEVVRRHGPLVLGVCRRVLRQAQDAEDAFQATFLVLARKAAAVAWRESVRNWLYDVAYRLALKARTTQARRRAAERQVHAMPRRDSAPSPDVAELAAVLDEELHDLPAKYREPLLLCYLEGKTRDEAARQLGYPLGTLKHHLERGRELLRKRLARRGITLAAALAAAELTSAAASAVPAALVITTARAACGFALGAAAEGVSAHSLALAQTALQARFASKVLALVLTLGFLTGAGLAAHQILTPPPPAEPVTTTDSSRPSPLAPRPLDLYGDPLPPGAVARLGTVRFRHGEAVSTLLYLPDGKTLVSAGYDNTIRVWEADTGKQLRQFGGHHSAIYSLALAPDGKTLTSGGNDNTIHLYDVTTGQELRRFTGHRQGGLTVAFSADGKTLATGSHDKTIILWDAATGRELRTLTGHEAEVCRLLFSADGRRLISAALDTSVRVWDTATGQQLHRLAGARDRVCALALCPGQDLVASAADDSTITLWDFVEGSPVRLFKGHGKGNGVVSLAFSPDGTTLASSSWDGTRLWDVASGTTTKQRPGCAWLAFSRDGKTLAAAPLGGWHNRIELWDGRTLEALRRPEGHLAAFRCLAVSPGNTLVAVGSYDHVICLWDVSLRQEPRQLTGHRFQVNAVAFSPDGKLLASGSYNQERLRLWDVATGQVIQTLESAPDGVMGVAFSPDGKTLAACGYHRVCLWDLTPETLPNGLRRVAGKALKEFGVRGEFYYSLAFSPEGKKLVTGKPKGLAIWDVAEGKEVRAWQVATRRPLGGPADPEGHGPLDGAYSVTFSPDGKLVTSASRLTNLLEFADCTVRLWDAATGQERRQFKGHESEINAVAFSPDGKTLASASMDGTIRLWEMATGRERARFTGHRGRVEALKFFANGRRLASASADTTALIWDVTDLEAAPVAQGNVAALWDDLAGDDAARAYRAGWLLTARPRESFALLKERLRPITRIEPARLGRLIADLDDNRFAVREQATAELERLAELAEPALRAALKNNPSAETRRRLERLVEQLNATAPAGRRLQALRAVEVLEHVSDDEARRQLKDLADGAPEAGLTQEAKAALQRLAKRP